MHTVSTFVWLVMWNLNSCHADASSDAEVQSLFDDIEYQKGGAVLRMLWTYMSGSHYASSRLPSRVQPGEDLSVSACLNSHQQLQAHPSVPNQHSEGGLRLLRKPCKHDLTLVPARQI